MSNLLSGARMLLECLVREGAECIFGYPGGVTLPFYDALYDHPMRHVLTMAIGVSGQLRVQHYRLHPSPGALVLLCSDGLHGVTPDEEIGNILAAGGSLEELCRKLVEQARAHGGPDNITTVLLKATT